MQFSLPFVASFKSSTSEVQRTANNFSTISAHEDSHEVKQRDENGNEVPALPKEKSNESSLSSGFQSGQEETPDLGQRARKSPIRVARNFEAVEFDTPSGLITTTTFHVNSPSSISAPARSPVYCFHSFTYGVDLSSENKGSQAGSLVKCDTIWEEESFDADSANVVRTRTVVDPVESGSPTMHSILLSQSVDDVDFNDILPSKGILNSESIEKFQSEINNNFSESENTSVFSSSHRDMTPGENQKPQLYLGLGDNGNSCDKKAVEKIIGRLSPEGAESSAVNVRKALENGDTGSRPGIPRNRYLNEARMLDKIGSGLSYSPSGYIDAQIEWTIEETQEENIDGKEDSTSVCHDRAPLIHPVKPHARYSLDEVCEEAEEGDSVTCCSCGQMEDGTYVTCFQSCCCILL